MKLGIVGLPNVGKSTLFNSLTKAGAESANYPFCTIDPNVGVVTVPDERIKLLGELYNTKKVRVAFGALSVIERDVVDKRKGFPCGVKARPLRKRSTHVRVYLCRTFLK